MIIFERRCPFYMVCLQNRRDQDGRTAAGETKIAATYTQRRNGKNNSKQAKVQNFLNRLMIGSNIYCKFIRSV